DELYQKGKHLDKGVKEFEEKMKELQDKIKRLQELLAENKNVPAQSNQAGEVEKGAQGLQDNVSQIQQLNEDVGSSLQSLQEQLESYKQEIEQLKQQIGQKQQGGKQEQSSSLSPGKGQGKSAPPASSPSSSLPKQPKQSNPISRGAQQVAKQFQNFGNQTKSGSGGGAKAGVKDKTAEIQSSLSAAEANEMLKILEPFRRPAAELAQEIKREMQKTVNDEWLEGMDSGELSDDFSRLADGKIFKKMLVKGRGEHRVMIVIDGSGSMGGVAVKIDGSLESSGGSDSMLGTMKMLLTVLLALKEIDGIEIGVMMYGDIANLLDISKGKDLTDEAIYRMFTTLARGNGNTEDVATLRSAVEKISEGGEGIFKSILHISDGGGDGRDAVQEFYKENAESGVKFVSYGIGSGTSALEEGYTPDKEIEALYPRGLAPTAKTVAKAEDLLGETAKYIEDMFKEERDETIAFGKRVGVVIAVVVEELLPSIWTGFVKDQAAKYGVKWTDNIGKLFKYLFEGRHGNWLLDDGDIKRKGYDKYLPSVETQKAGGYIVKVSKAPLDLTIVHDDTYMFATVSLNPETGLKEIIIHQSVLEYIKNNGPPQGYSAETFIEDQLIAHELEEYDYVVVKQKGIYNNFHALTKDKYAALFKVGDAIAGGDDSTGAINYLGYADKNGQKYLRIKIQGQTKPVEVKVDDRSLRTVTLRPAISRSVNSAAVSIDKKEVSSIDSATDAQNDKQNRVKLYKKENGQWKEFIPGELGVIPDLIGYSVGNSNRINAYKFTAGNRDLLKRMLTAYSKPASDARNTNIWLEGEKGSGKNALSFVFAGLVGIPMRFVSLHANTTQKDISERTILTQGTQEVEMTLETGETIIAQIPASITKHEFSEIYQAALNGELVIIDEADKVKLEGVMSALNTILTRERISGLTYDDRFRVIMLSNDHLTNDVSGNDLNRKNRDLLSRMTKIKVPYPEFAEEYERIMDGIYGDLEDGSKEKEMLSNVMSFLITLADWSRNAQKGIPNKYNGQKIDFPKLSKSISPRAVIKIAKHLHPDNYFNDMEYMGSLIDAAFGTDLLNDKEREKFNGFLSQFGTFKRFNHDAQFAMGYDKLEDADFEYMIENGAVYAALGKGAWKVKVKTAIEPAKIEEARKRLKSQYQLPGNMVLFWEWMKDINLGDNIMVLGVPGTGKTVLTSYLLNTVLGFDAQSMQMNVESSGTDLIGAWSLVNGVQVFQESSLVQAMREGKPIIIDEADKPRDETALAVLNNILQDGFIVLPNDGRSEEERTVYAKEGFFAVTAGNLPNKGGTASTRISGEVTDRHSVYVLEPLSEEQTVEMMKRYAQANGYKMPKGFIENLTKFHFEIMNDGKIKEKPSIRTLEKTIGTLARNPIRFNDVKNVYLEGFSLSNNSLAKKFDAAAIRSFAEQSLNKNIYINDLGRFKEALPKMLTADGLKLNLRELCDYNGGSDYYIVKDEFKITVLEPIYAFFDEMEMSGYDNAAIEKIRKSLEKDYAHSHFAEDNGPSTLDEFQENTKTIVSDLKILVEDFEAYIQKYSQDKKTDFNVSVTDKNGRKYLDISGVSAPIDIRRDDPRRVKLFLSGEDNAKEVFPQDLAEIPETVYYQIGEGEKVPFVFTNGNKELLQRMLATYGKPESDARNTNLWLEGQKGSGKNALSYIFAGLLGAPVRYVNLHANTTQKDISERTVLDKGYKKVKAVTPDGREIEVEIPANATIKQFSEIYKAAVYGELVIIDEADKVKLDGVLSALNTVLTRDNVKGLTYDPRFRVIVLSNEHETNDVNGKDLNLKARDFISRLTKIEVPYPAKDEEIARVMGSVFGDLVKDSKEYNDAKSVISDIVDVAAKIRDSKVLKKPFSPRSVLRIAKHIKAFPVDKENLHNLINTSYGTEALSEKEQEEFKKIMSGLQNNQTFEDMQGFEDFFKNYNQPELGAGVEIGYDKKNRRIYVRIND
ncbi:MAG: AAA family ATPase, partial [Endomicrobia bacterium]|nr:AAA family ATPase [Endomicrobiia bacterium]